MSKRRRVAVLLAVVALCALGFVALTRIQKVQRIRKAVTLLESLSGCQVAPLLTNETLGEYSVRLQPLLRCSKEEMLEALARVDASPTLPGTERECRRMVAVCFYFDQGSCAMGQEGLLPIEVDENGVMKSTLYSLNTGPSLVSHEALERYPDCAPRSMPADNSSSAR